jgi:hypothetical protein
MGGLNCGGNGHLNPLDPASSRVLDEYVHRLADYCKPLFEGVAEFYLANVAIERAVKGSPGEIDAAILALHRSKELIDMSRRHLGGVAPMWELVSTEPVDFRDQSDRLRCAIEAIGDVHIELGQLSQNNGTNLQHEIWGRPAITSYMVEASSLLSEALAWQSQFAAQTAALAIAA